jgi:hypothetical protein
MRKTRMIVRAAIIVAALSTAGAAVAAGVSLPTQANKHAFTATANVTTGSSNSSNGQSDDVHPASTPSPNDHAKFGQCVAAHAKTASDQSDHGNGTNGWNPTVGCTKANASGGNASSNASATTGLANAETHANSNASTRLQTASTESATGQAHAH